MKDVPDDRPITVTVLGAFPSGKSTFINATFNEGSADLTGSGTDIATTASVGQSSHAIATRLGRLWGLLRVLFIVFFKSSTF